jgi:putative transposase
LGNPIRLLLSAGQQADVSYAPLLLEDIPAKALIADKAYDSNKLIDSLVAQQPDILIVIPPKRNRKVQRDYDKELYKDRNKVERFFNRLKHYRRIATRYEKTARNYLSFILLASSLVLLL